MATLLERIPYIYGKVPAASLPEPSHSSSVNIRTNFMCKSSVNVRNNMKCSGKNAAGTARLENARLKGVENVGGTTKYGKLNVT